MRDLRYKEGPRRALEVFLCGFVLALFALAPAIFPYGGRFVMRGDYMEQQIPFILETKRMFASGTPFWSWNTLFGGNFLGNYAFYTVGSPFVWILLPLPEAAIPYGISVVAMLKLGVCALAAHLYLRRFVSNARYAQLGGLLYAFSGFTIINTQFYHFTDIIAVFPLLLLAIEDTFSENRHPGAAALACALNVLVNYYFFLGTVLFAVLYVLFRLFSVDWRATRSLKRMVILAFECGLGCLMAAVLLFPAAWTMLGISRTGRFMVFEAGEKYEIWDILERLRVLFMPIESSIQHAFYGNAASWASVGVCLPLLGMAGVFYSVYKKPLRWHHWLLLLLLVISMIMPINRLFVLGSNNTYTRWWYGLVLILCLITVQALDDYRPEIRKDRQTMGASLLTCLLCTLALAGPFLLPQAWLDALAGLGGPLGRVASFVRWEQGMPYYATDAYRIFSVCAWSLNFLLCCVAFLPGIYKRGRVVLAMLCLCAVVNYAGFIYLNNAHQQSGGNVDYMTDVDYYVYHELDQPKPQFAGTTYTHRVDAPPKILNYGMLIDQPSISNFHSIRSKYLDDFLAMGGLSFSELPYAYPYDQEDGALRTLLGVKYYYNYDEEHYPGAPEGFTYKGLDGEVSVYENEYVLPMGFAYTHYTTSYHHAVGPKTIGQVMLNALILDAHNELDMRDDFQLLSETETLLSWQDAAAERAGMACYDVEMTSRGLTAKIDLEERLFVFFSVPYDRGWTATVNGEPAEVLRANYSFLGVMADPGEGIEIELRFFPRGLKQGAVTSILATLVLVGYVLFLRKRRASSSRKEIGHETLPEDAPNESEGFDGVQTPCYTHEKTKEPRNMEKIKELWNKLKSNVGLIRYIIIGVLTTLVNYLVYALVTRVFLSPAYWFVGRIVAWIAAVAFSYVGNKLYVFESKTHGAKDLAREIGSFVVMRLASLGLDVLIMWVLVDLLHINDLIATIISNVIVVITNYVFSKFFIFTGAKKKESAEDVSQPTPNETEPAPLDEKEEEE